VGPKLPHPNNVPDRGLWVSTDSNGANAISAIKYTAPPRTEIRTLILTVFQSSGTGAIIEACPTASPWKQAEAGVWSQRPTPRCGSASVNGVRSPDGSKWTFDVRGLGRTGSLNIVLLPPGDASTNFSVSFQAPSSSSIVTHALAGSPSPSSSPPPPKKGGGGGFTPFPTPSLSGFPTVAPSPSPFPTSYVFGSPTPDESPYILAGPVPPSGSGPRGAGWAGLLFAVPTVLLVGAGYGSRVLARRRIGPRPSQA
jgi:hypothetical protein